MRPPVAQSGRNPALGANSAVDCAVSQPLQGHPAGTEAIAWTLLTNEPVQTFPDAWRVASWYERRWIIEEFHKAKKTGCSIESLQFHDVERLRPAIGVLSILALSLLAIRDSARNPQARDRLACDDVDEEYIEVLSLWRHRKCCPHWTT